MKILSVIKSWFVKPTVIVEETNAKPIELVTEKVPIDEIILTKKRPVGRPRKPDSEVKRRVKKTLQKV